VTQLSEETRATTAHGSPWLTYDELADYTRYAKATLHVMQHEGLLPRSYGKGRSRRFHIDDVEAWMRNEARGLRK
jgi:excisionase family DNA binding protein